MTDTRIVPIVMPKWGLSMKEGKVTGWLLEDGSKINPGDAILEVETDKIAGSVDTTVGCPTIGTGIIDVSNAACDTFGEIINKVMGQSSNWILAPGALLASESSNASLASLSATDTNAADSSSPHGVRSPCALRDQALKSTVPALATSSPRSL